MVRHPYTIQLPVYQGPLDLLLDLINRAELDITKVALAQVTDQYLAYLHTLADYELSNLSSFLVVAARLLQIKSEALLPRPPEREADEEDPGEALTLQLIAYKKYREVAELLSEREEAGLRSYLRLVAPHQVTPKLSLDEFTLDDLYSAYVDVLSARPKDPPLDEVVPLPRVSLRDRIRAIINELRNKGKTTFRLLLNSATSRVDIVVSFLAVLELVKQRKIQVSQDQGFGEIDIIPGDQWKTDQKWEFDLEFDE